jgi:hypothetical protein
MFKYYLGRHDRLCGLVGLVVRVPGYRSRDLGSILFTSLDLEPPDLPACSVVLPCAQD